MARRPASNRRPPPATRRERNAKVRRVLWSVLVVNVLVACLKVGVGTSTGALALLADGLHSFLDGTSNVIALVGLAAAERAPDRRHPYGHRRYATIAALGIGLLIGFGFLSIVASTFQSLSDNAPKPRPEMFSIAIVTTTVVINVVLSLYEARRARALGSDLLAADSSHTLSDAFASTLVLASFGATAIGWSWADPVAALLIGALIGRTAWKVLRHNLDVLADRAPLNETEVARVVQSVPGVVDTRSVRSRGATDAVFVDLSIQVDRAMRVDAAHALSHRVSEAISSHFSEVIDVVVHIEPEGSTSSTSPAD